MDAKRSAFLDVGFGNVVPTTRILAIVGYDSDPMRRMVSELEQSHKVVDATRGRKVRSVIVLEGETLILSTLTRSALTERLEGHSSNSELSV